MKSRRVAVAAVSSATRKSYGAGLLARIGDMLHGIMLRSRSLAHRFDIARGFWALGDQGVVSLGNFLTAIALARSMPQDAFGLYAILSGFLLLANSLHAALITYPLSVRGAEADWQGLRRYGASTLVMTFVLALPLAGALALPLAIMDQIRLLPWLALALLFWQLQETMRRALIAHLRHRTALLGDAISYLGQALVVVIMAQFGVLTIANAFIAMAAMSGLALIVQLVQVRPLRVGVRETRDHVAGFWSLGRWVLGSRILSMLTLQSISWVLAFFHGLAETGALRAVVNLTGASHPVMFGVSGLIIPATARAYQSGGIGRAGRTAVGYASQGLILLLPLFLVLLIAPKAVLGLVYGENSPYTAYAWALQLMTVAYLLLFLSNMLQSFLNGLGKSRATFRSDAVAALTATIVGLPMIALFGLIGANGAAILNALSRGVACLVLIRRLR